MAKIFCIIGKSGSGKDTIFKEVKNKTNLKSIVGYTTRPMREGEVDGREYFFVSPERLLELEASDQVIECRNYETVHGIWSYFTVADKQITDLNEDCIYIATLESYSRLVEYLGRNKVVPIYIELEDGLRLKRALEREINQDKPKYAELCRRFIADSNDFSEEHIRKAGIIKRFENTDLDKCVSEIIDYIESVREN